MRAFALLLLRYFGKVPQQGTLGPSIPKRIASSGIFNLPLYDDPFAFDPNAQTSSLQLKKERHQHTDPKAL
jgi:hypothetical protein